MCLIHILLCIFCSEFTFSFMAAPFQREQFCDIGRVWRYDMSRFITRKTKH